MHRQSRSALLRYYRTNKDGSILAIKYDCVHRYRNGYHKNKSGDKLTETEEDLLEHRTDGSDTFDTLYISCEKFPYRDAFSLSISGVL